MALSLEDNSLLQWDFFECAGFQNIVHLLFGVKVLGIKVFVWIMVLFEFLKSDYPSKSYEHLKIIHYNSLTRPF